MTSAPNRAFILELVEEAIAHGARQSKACEVIGLTTRTYQRWKHPNSTGEDGRPRAIRPTPQHKLSQEEKDRILDTIHQPAYANKPPSQIVPILADEGIYIASESTYYRVMREAKEQQHRGPARAPQKRPLSSHCALAPNQVWSWDITYLNGPVKGLYFYLYLILDVYSRDIMAWEVWPEESAEHASQLVQKAVLGQRLYDKQEPLVLHSDNGSPMKGATLLTTLYTLGIIPSRSRPGVSNDNAYSESLFKTCKYRPDFPLKGFASLEDARNWCLKFVHWYRYEHRHSGVQFLTPNQAHTGRGEEILENRQRVYAEARKKNPLRRKNNTRRWALEQSVWLNKQNDDIQDLRQLS